MARFLFSMLWQLLLIVIVSTFSVNNHAHPPYTGKSDGCRLQIMNIFPLVVYYLNLNFVDEQVRPFQIPSDQNWPWFGFISCAKIRIGKIFLSLVQPYLCTHEVWSLYVKLKFVWRRKRFVRRFLLWGQPVCLKFCVCGANPAEDYKCV